MSSKRAATHWTLYTSLVMADVRTEVYTKFAFELIDIATANRDVS